MARCAMPIYKKKRRIVCLKLHMHKWRTWKMSSSVKKRCWACSTQPGHSMSVLCVHGHNVGSAAVEQHERGLNQHCPLDCRSFSPSSIKETLQTEQVLDTEAFQSCMETQCKEVADCAVISALKKIILRCHLGWGQHLYKCIKVKMFWEPVNLRDPAWIEWLTACQVPVQNHCKIQIWRHEDWLPLQLESLSVKRKLLLKCSWQLQATAMNCTEVLRTLGKTTPALRRIMVLG